MILNSIKKNFKKKPAVKKTVKIKEEIKIEEPLVLHKKDIAEKATKETKQETKSSLTFGV